MAPTPRVPSTPSGPHRSRPPVSGERQLRVSPRYIWLLIIAQFGVYMALVTPLGLSLSIRVSELAPQHEEYLGYITGAGGAVAVVAPPLIGRASDRMHSRFGRRRPYLAATTVVGLLALIVLAEAPNLLILGVGWALAQLGWGTILCLLLASQADRLPEEQRGKVSGLAGAVGQLAPVAGVVLAGGFAHASLPLFLAPGALGVVGMALFICLVPETDSRTAELPDDPFSLKALAVTYLFSPRRSPDFAWNWLGKFLSVFGLTLTSTFTAFFLATREHVSVADVAGTVAVLSIGSIACAMVGAVGGGVLSDRLRRRRVFTLAGACVFAAGSVVMALAASIPVIMAGALFSNLGVGLFSSVDQALALDVLPDRQTNAGRFIGIYNFATSIPQAIAPLIAPLILAMGAEDGVKNYTLLYLTAAAFSITGGLIVLLRVKSVR